MTRCDTNIWLALALSRHIHRKKARRWFQSVAEPRTIFFCRATQQPLLRLLTNFSVLAAYGNPPLTNVQPWKAYEAFQ